MGVKIVLGLAIIIAILGGMIFFLNEYVDTVESLTIFTGDMISAANVSSGIDVLYSFEDYFYEKEQFMSLFVHDSILEELRLLIVDIRSAYFNGDRILANSQIVLLRERLLQLRRAILPSVENVL